MDATTTQKARNAPYAIDTGTTTPEASGNRVTNQRLSWRRAVVLAAVVWALFSGVAAIAISPPIVESSSLGAVSAKPTVDGALRGGERIYAPLVDWGFGRSSHIPAPINITLELRYIDIPQAARKVTAALYTQGAAKEIAPGTQHPTS